MRLKKIKFSDYEKYFEPIFKINSGNNTNSILFYKLLNDGLRIQFSFDLFIIEFTINYDSIKEMYPKLQISNYIDYDVRGSSAVVLNNEYAPYVKKFLIDKCFGRAILEIE